MCALSISASFGLCPSDLSCSTQLRSTRLGSESHHYKVAQGCGKHLQVRTELDVPAGYGMIHMRLPANTDGIHFVPFAVLQALTMQFYCKKLSIHVTSCPIVQHDTCDDSPAPGVSAWLGSSLLRLLLEAGMLSDLRMPRSGPLLAGGLPPGDLGLPFCDFSIARPFEMELSKG